VPVHTVSFDPFMSSGPSSADREAHLVAQTVRIRKPRLVEIDGSF
jgi:hypothetical protein